MVTQQREHAACSRQPHHRSGPKSRRTVLPAIQLYVQHGAPLCIQQHASAHVLRPLPMHARSSSYTVAPDCVGFVLRPLLLLPQLRDPRRCGCSLGVYVPPPGSLYDPPCRRGYGTHLLRHLLRLLEHAHVVVAGGRKDEVHRVVVIVRQQLLVNCKGLCSVW